MSNFKCGAASHSGDTGSQQLDHFIADTELGLWLVSDGVTQGSHGDVASKMAADVITASVKQGDELTSAIQSAHADIVAEAANDDSTGGMIATVVAAHETEDALELAWVGNSRAYLYDMSKPQQIHQLSRDHSYMQLLVDTGTFTVEDLMSKKNQNVLTVSLGDDEIEDLNADHMQQNLTLTQKLILCSDGLNKALADEDIASIMSQSQGIEKNAQELVKAAVDNGGSDNVTVIVISRA